MNKLEIHREKLPAPLLSWNTEIKTKSPFYHLSLSLIHKQTNIEPFSPTFFFFFFFFFSLSLSRDGKCPAFVPINNKKKNHRGTWSCTQDNNKNKKESPLVVLNLFEFDGFGSGRGKVYESLGVISSCFTSVFLSISIF